MLRVKIFMAELPRNIRQCSSASNIFRIDPILNRNDRFRSASMRLLQVILTSFPNSQSMQQSFFRVFLGMAVHLNVPIFILEILGLNQPNLAFMSNQNRKGHYNRKQQALENSSVYNGRPKKFL